MSNVSTLFKQVEKSEKNEIILELEYKLFLSEFWKIFKAMVIVTMLILVLIFFLYNCWKGLFQI